MGSDLVGFGVRWVAVTDGDNVKKVKSERGIGCFGWRRVACPCGKDEVAAKRRKETQKYKKVVREGPQRGVGMWMGGFLESWAG